MASPALTAPTALIMAVCFHICSGPTNAALLVFFTAIRQRRLFADLLDLLDPVLLRDALKVIVASSAAACLLIALRWIARGRVGTPRWNGPGKALFFPCRTSHTRNFPRNHSFSYSYLMVGVPVGFEGSAGGMVSVAAQGKPTPSSWSPIAPKGGWFAIDAGDYLARGKPELGLQGKLAEYLRAQVSLYSQPSSSSRC